MRNCRFLLYSNFTKMLPTVKYISKLCHTKMCDAKILFVPFADEQNKYYLALCKQALLLAGAKKQNISTLTSHTHKTTNYDIIFVSGGNVCRLKDKLCQIGWQDEILRQVGLGALYIGDSAGSVFAGQDISHTLEYEPYDVPLKSYSGLGLIDKCVVVHYSLYRFSTLNGFVMEEDCFLAHVKQANKLASEQKKVCTIANNQVIIYNGKKIKQKFLSNKKIAKSTIKESKKYHKK